MTSTVVVTTARIKISSDNALDAFPVTRIPSSSALINNLSSSIENLRSNNSSSSSSSNNFTTAIFTDEYRNYKPVILTGVAAGWFQPVISCSRIIELCEPGDVDVLLAKDGRNFLKHHYCTTQRVSLEDGLRAVLTQVEGDDGRSNHDRLYVRIYLVDHPRVLAELDLDFLTRLAFGDSHIQESTSFSSSRNFQPKNIGLWASSSQCVTPLHFDLCHGFLAQIHGHKTFIMANSDDSTLLHYWMDNRHNVHSGDNNTTSPINLIAWLEGSDDERKRYTHLDEVGWFIAQLCPGDVLYTPPGWWHCVISETSSCSVLIPFDPLPDNEQLPAIVLMVA